MTIDGFTDGTGATRVRDAFVDLRTSQGHTIVERGDATKPTRLHKDASGMVTTSFFFESGNTLVRLVNVCRLCSPDDVNREVQPVVQVVRALFPQGR